MPRPPPRVTTIFSACGSSSRGRWSRYEGRTCNGFVVAAGFRQSVRHDEIRELVGPGGVDIVRRGNARECRHGQSKARREHRREHYRRLVAYLELDGKYHG